MSHKRLITFLEALHAQMCGSAAYEQLNTGQHRGLIYKGIVVACCLGWNKDKTKMKGMWSPLHHHNACLVRTNLMH